MKNATITSTTILVLLILTFSYNLFAQVDSLKVTVDANSTTVALKNNAKNKTDSNKLKNDLKTTLTDTYDLHLSGIGGSFGTKLLQSVDYPNSVWQKMVWDNLDVYIIMKANFSKQEGGYLYFDLMQKTGNIEFKATATGQDFLETFTKKYNLDNYVENSIKEGTLTYSLVEKKITYMNMNFGSEYFGNVIYQNDTMYVQVKFPPKDNLWFTGTNSYFPIPQPDFDLGEQFPTASIKYTPENPKTNETITFDASDSSDPDPGDPYTLAAFWDFGDGTTGSGRTTAHSYATPGEYDACLIIIDIHNLRDKICKKISITQGPQPPQAKFNYFPENPSIGDVITFDANDSYDPDSDGEIVSYNWDFGDGRTASGKIAQIKYAEIASYTITLTVEDNTGLQDMTSRIIDFTGEISSFSGTVYNISLDNKGNLNTTNSLKDAKVELYENGNFIKSTVTASDGGFNFDEVNNNKKYELHISATGRVDRSMENITINKTVNDIFPVDDHKYSLPLQLTIQKYNLIYDLGNLGTTTDLFHFTFGMPLIKSYDESSVISLLTEWNKNITPEEIIKIQGIARLLIAEQVLDSLYENAAQTTRSMSQGIYNLASGFMGFKALSKSKPTLLYNYAKVLAFYYFIKLSMNMIQSVLPESGEFYPDMISKALNIL